VLTVATAAVLRGALFKCLAEQPEAVVVEAAGLAAADDIALTLFRTVAHHASAWPCIPVVLCSPPAELVAQLHQLGLDRHVIVCATLDAARAHARRRPLPDRVRHTFPPESGSVTLARHLVTDACQRWHLPHLVPMASLVTSELVGNAVRHAGTEAEVTVHRADRHLYVAVRDYDEHLPKLVGTAAETDPGGRGLLLVSAMATAWGCIPLLDGKVAWAAVSTTPR